MAGEGSSTAALISAIPRVRRKSTGDRSVQPVFYRTTMTPQMTESATSGFKERLMWSIPELRDLEMNDELLSWGPAELAPKYSPCLFDTTPLDQRRDADGIPTGDYVLRASYAGNGWCLNLDITPQTFPVRVRTRRVR